ncbi:MAG: hypothetical protein AB7L09_15470 [Nitrospira sp.]
MKRRDLTKRLTQLERWGQPAELPTLRFLCHGKGCTEQGACLRSCKRIIVRPNEWLEQPMVQTSEAEIE